MAQVAGQPSTYLIPGTDDDVLESYGSLAGRALTMRFGLVEPRVVVLDTETTGLDVDVEELTEIAALVLDGPDIVDSFHTFVNPGKHIPEFVTDLTSITDSDVAGAPSPQQAVADLAAFVGDMPIVAHNARFDRGFIARHAAAAELHAAVDARAAADAPAADDPDDDPAPALSPDDDPAPALAPDAPAADDPDDPAPGGISDPGRWIDSLELSRIALPRLCAHDQATICEAFGVAQGGHRALGDAEALARIWRIMLVALSDMPRELLSFLENLAPGASWPTRLAISLARDTGEELHFSMYALRDDRLSRHARGAGAARFIDPDPDQRVLDPAPLDLAEIEEAFSPEGVVGRMYPNFERRPEQVDFALDVAQAFETSTHRVIEAGTGVGKSISYLLPSVMFALRNHVHVGVSTKTNTLLDQLMLKELPRLRDALNEVAGVGFSYIAVKGYDHYPCLRKLMRFANGLGASSSTFDIAVASAVLTSISQSVWGDLDGVSLPINRHVRASIACSAEDCLRSKCGYFRGRRCLAHGTRNEAAASEIVVTNHALLFRNASLDRPILPAIRYWVLDEAHGVEGEARHQFSCFVEAGELLSHLGKLGAQNGPVKRMAELATALDGGVVLLGSASAVLQLAPSVQGLADRFFDFVKGLAEWPLRGGRGGGIGGGDVRARGGGGGGGRPYARRELWVDDDMRASEPWRLVADAGDALLRELDRLLKGCADLISLAEQFPELDEGVTELATLRLRLSEAFESLSLILDGSDKDYYYYLVVGADAAHRGETMVASPVDLGRELVEKFFASTNSSILTSATVAVGESFDFFAHRVGLDRLEDGMWDSHRLEPQEGFYANMRALVVGDVPDPRSKAAYLDAMEALLIEAHVGLGGGILTLFTNKRDMAELYTRVRPALKARGIELLCQGQGRSKRSISEEFTKNEDASLFATRSFWEGFDAPGRTLRCVILPKLPFVRPDDPLYQEMSKRQGDAWRAYALPQAIIDTKQAAGRLIRSKSDAGFLILADSRLVTKGYGKVFLRCLAFGNLQVVSAADVRGILESFEG